MCVGSPDAAPLPHAQPPLPRHLHPHFLPPGPWPRRRSALSQLLAHLWLPPGSQPGRAETHFLPTGPGLHGSRAVPAALGRLQLCGTEARGCRTRDEGEGQALPLPWGPPDPAALQEPVTWTPCLPSLSLGEAERQGRDFGLWVAAAAWSTVVWGFRGVLGSGQGS